MRAENKDEDYVPEMPELPGAEHMLNHLWSAGPCMAGGMGPSPLSHVEIRAWQDNTGNLLNGWEADTLHGLSAAYTVELEAAKAPGRPAPYIPAPTPDARAAVAAQMQRQMSGLMSNKGGLR